MRLLTVLLAQAAADETESKHTLFRLPEFEKAAEASSLAEVRPLFRDTSGSVSRIFHSVKPKCAAKACGDQMTTCLEDPRYTEGDCHKRMMCVKDHIAKRGDGKVSECYAGMRWSDLHPHEVDLVECTIKAGCLKADWDQKLTSSFLEALRGLPSRGEEHLRDVLAREHRALQGRAQGPPDGAKYIPEKPSSFLEAPQDAPQDLEDAMPELAKDDEDRDDAAEQQAHAATQDDDRVAREDEQKSAEDMSALIGDIGTLNTKLHGVFEPKDRPAPAFDPSLVPANQGLDGVESFAQLDATAKAKAKWDSAPDSATYQTQIGELEQREASRAKKTQAVLENLSASIEGLTKTPVAPAVALPRVQDDPRGVADAEPDLNLFHTQQDHLADEEQELDALAPLPSGPFDSGPQTRLKTMADIPVEDILRPPTSYIEVGAKGDLGQLRRAP